MEEGKIKVGGREYLLGPGGIVLDADGNVSGFLGAELVQKAGYADTARNIVDAIGSSLAAKAPEGAKDPRAGAAFSAGQLGAIGAGAAGAASIAYAGYEAYQAYQAGNEADQAEARAREMEARLRARKARNSGT